MRWDAVKLFFLAWLLECMCIREGDGEAGLGNLPLRAFLESCRLFGTVCMRECKSGKGRGKLSCEFCGEDLKRIVDEGIEAPPFAQDAERFCCMQLALLYAAIFLGCGPLDIGFWVSASAYG